MSSHKASWTIALFLVGCGLAIGQETTSAPAAASKEHGWLQQFVGEWVVSMVNDGDSNQTAAEPIGTEVVRAFGGHWVIAESKLKAPTGDSLDTILTMGHDPNKKKYVAHWICSQLPDQWVYDGMLNDSGTTLTFEAEGPNPALGGKLSKFRDVIEFKTKDHRVHSSFILGPDGSWTNFSTADYRRKKQ